MKRPEVLGVVFFAVVSTSCSAVTSQDTGTTGRTIKCGNEERNLVDCQAAFDQYARTVRFDIALIKQAASGVGIGVEKLMELDAVSSDLIAHQRQLCVDYNNCIISNEEYRREHAYVRRAQMQIRKAAAQLSGGGPPGMDGGDYGGTTSSQPPGSPAAYEALVNGIIEDFGKADETGGGQSYY